MGLINEYRHVLGNNEVYMIYCNLKIELTYQRMQCKILSEKTMVHDICK